MVLVYVTWIFMQVKDLNTFSSTDYTGYITDKSEKSAISAE